VQVFWKSFLLLWTAESIWQVSVHFFGVICITSAHRNTLDSLRLSDRYKSLLCSEYFLAYNFNTHIVPSVLWRCWLGCRKGIRPVKNWVVGCWRGYLSGARCRLAYGPADATATHSLASQKSRLVLPFWYRLTRVVPERGPLNVCVCVCVCVLMFF